MGPMVGCLTHLQLTECCQRGVTRPHWTLRQTLGLKERPVKKVHGPGKRIRAQLRALAGSAGWRGEAGRSKTLGRETNSFK